uniref:aquaporin-11 n=1 Tax=Pristiophorus japonicus TaxID=55135 RepID=UPI00398EA1FD
MEDTLVSLGVLAGTVTVCQVLRRTAKELLHPRGRRRRVSLEVATELFSTLQLCVCTHELQLLIRSGLLPGRYAGLAFTYLITLVHLATFGSATCNPINCLEQYLRGQSSGRAVASKVLAQFGAASVARRLCEMVWYLDMSDLHWHHHQLGYHSTSSLNANTRNGLVAEFLCGFALRVASFRFQHLQPWRKMHAVAALITFLVFAAGDLTGAVFNPALAYSITFNCEGNTFLQYSFVYWLGPLLGTVTAVLMFDNRSVPSDAETEYQEESEKRD